jgi:large repetitive protein
MTVTIGSTSGFVSVTASSGFGTSAASTLPVTVNAAAPSTPGSITRNTSTCSNLSGNVYTISPIADATDSVLPQ